MRIETDLDSDKVYAIEKHYLEAREKHPYFCDVLFREDRKRVDGGPDEHLAMCRAYLDRMLRLGEVDFLDVADCEVAEAFAAYCNGDVPKTIEEVYDVIAVLLRVVDVLQGRQELGRPNEGEVEQ